MEKILFLWLASTGVDPAIFKISRLKLQKNIEVMLADWNGQSIAVSYLLNLTKERLSLKHGQIHM